MVVGLENLESKMLGSRDVEPGPRLLDWGSRDDGPGPLGWGFRDAEPGLLGLLGLGCWTADLEMLGLDLGLGY